ncbi:MAG: tRNA-dihydrouridine synthase B [Granulosicoccus sp.]|jgi:tRNA-dihydrouridine synthase B
MAKMIEIGAHVVLNPVFLAPMAGISDRPFRDLCAREGAGYAASEMISSDTLLYATAKTRHRIVRANNALPHAVQIAGSEPAAMADAAALNVQHGAQVIDINMGCPAKKVCNRLAGSALLADPDHVRAILKAVVARVDVPVTLKIRTGPTPETRNGVLIAKIAQEEGIACLAVHGRTRSDRFKGQAEYDTIAAIVDAVAIPVIANGDIHSGSDAKAVLKQTGAAGIMIGRAAQGNPWVFREISAVLNGLSVPGRPEHAEIGQTLLTHLQGCHQLYGDYRGVRIARKHIAWYCKGLRHATTFRELINKVENPLDQMKMVEAFFTQPDAFADAFGVAA